MSWSKSKGLESKRKRLLSLFFFLSVVDVNKVERGKSEKTFSKEWTLSFVSTVR